MSDNAGVTQTSDQYDRELPTVKRNKDAVKGQAAIKAAEDEYLYPLGSMLSPSGAFTADGRRSYNKYLLLALFFNAAGRTVEGLTGLIYRKPGVIELPDDLEYLRTNVDGSQTTLRSQMQSSTMESFPSVRSGLLVDFPDSKGKVSRADAEAMNLQPKILMFPFESIIKWNYETVNNQRRLNLVVIREVVKTRKDRFSIDEEFAYRVLELIPEMQQDGDGKIGRSGNAVYHHSLYDKSGTEITPQTVVLVNGAPSDEIPFYLMEPSGGKAPITDLVDVNLNHYNMFASYANKEHTSGFPVFWETGVTGAQDESGNVVDTNTSIGPGAKWVSASTEAQFGILETKGDGGSIRTYLEDRKVEMASLGAEMLNPQKMAAEAAESKRLDQQAQNSTAGNVAIIVFEAYEKALKFCARWLGVNEDGVIVKPNLDFLPDTMSPQLLQQLTLMLQNGDISYETFYENLQRGEIANPTRTAEQEQSQIASDGNGL